MLCPAAFVTQQSLQSAAYCGVIIMLPISRSINAIDPAPNFSGNRRLRIEVLRG